MGTGLGTEDLPTIGYARVTAPGQEASLTQQEQLLEGFCAAKGWRHEIVSDSGRAAGSGPGAGFKRLLNLILYKRIGRAQGLAIAVRVSLDCAVLYCPVLPNWVAKW
jgi:hypothetical protein